MQTRRDFLKNAAILSGTAAFWSVLEGPIRAASAIAPEPGSTFYDAEHIVVLMQENRSFDHCFGTLQGVRGFNDPRAISLANGNPVWVQTNAAGESYAPFRLDITGTKATWMGSLPHSWPTQVDARNGGQHDKWLIAKRPHQKGYTEMPLTMGYYNREDIPFYYSLADAFTVCDQHFCSSITPTLPNRLYLMTGTVRPKQQADSQPMVRNDQIEKNDWEGWVTFPERLEKHGVAWKVYQNEVTEPSGMKEEEAAWLSNFGCNILEYFKQYQVKFSPTRMAFLEQQAKELPAEIAALHQKMEAGGLSEAEKKELAKKEEDLQIAHKERETYTPENFEKLSAFERNLHEKAFAANRGDPAYRELVDFEYEHEGKQRKVQVPKGDVLHQFREDVQQGNLPTISWLVAPERLSDHPESAWYGAWYLSETMRILTENPEVWKKTIFILTYDENDGYFDHVPPFVAPHPKKKETGFTSQSVDATLDFIDLEQDQKAGFKDARESPIGLGYRVPMVIASPWTRGGCVCSQVFDNTSILQFMEKFLEKKTGKHIREENISTWRRAICGDMTFAFQRTAAEKGKEPAFVGRDEYIERIHLAQSKPLPSGYHLLSEEEIKQIRKEPAQSPHMPQQEKGIRRACPAPYELFVDGKCDGDRFVLKLAAKTERFGDRSAGAPFTVYIRNGQGMTVRNYAVAAGESVEDSWKIDTVVPDGGYAVEVRGPNGFLRGFAGSPGDSIHVTGEERADGNLELLLKNNDRRALDVRIKDTAYKTPEITQRVEAGEKVKVTIDTSKNHRWYALSVECDAPGPAPFACALAGKVETREWTYTDPAMGRVI